MADLQPPVARAHHYVPQPRAHWTAASVGLRDHTGPLRVSHPLSVPPQQQPLYQQAAPGPEWNP
jgi:hypothetical protein